MRIQHNIPALNAHRNLTNNNSAVSKNLEKLSSGYRINRAGDDAAGLAISEKMRAQITGLQTAQKNAEDGVSLVQTAEGALTEVHSMLNRMVELATQSANGTYSESNRQEMQKEIDALNEEIDRISATSNFNGTKLFQGGGANGAAAGVPDIKGLDMDPAAGGSKFTVTSGVILANAETGLTANQNYKVTFTYADKAGDTKTATVELAYDHANGTLNGTKVAKTGEITQAEFAKEVAKALKETGLKDTFKITDKTDGTLQIDAKENNSAIAVKSFEVTGSPNTNNNIVFAGLGTAGVDDFQKFDFNGFGLKETFTIGGKKFAFVGSDADAFALGSDVNAIKVANGTSVAGADVTAMAALIEQKTGYKPNVNGTALEFKAPTGAAGGAGGDVTIDLHVGESSDDANKISVKIKAMSSASLGVQGLDIGTAAGAKTAIDTVNKAIDDVSSIRSDLGALQNRLEHTINNLGVQTENITAAESRIRDVDMAKEMMAYTKNNILVQASQAMLAQANQVPQGGLQLLQ